MAAVLKWNLKLAALLMVFAVSAAFAADTTSQMKLEEQTLKAFANVDTKETTEQLEQIKQEVLIAQQNAINLQFLLQQACCVKMDNVFFPSGTLLIPGYVFTPPKMQSGKRYPAVVLVHGGFHQHFNVEWFKTVADLVKRGYVVVFPEYRGSQGYGAQIYRNDYGSSDVADVLAAADYIAAKPYVDSKRLGIFGESRGGMVTLLAIEQAPERFKVAVDVVGLTDFVAYMAYKPEWRRQEVAKESAGFGGQLPNTNLAAYMKVSPINYVEKIQTPLLVVATTGDEIAPLALHTGRLIEALKAYNKVYESKIYDNAPGGHTFLRGDTKEADDAHERIGDWLDKHLQ